MRIVFAQQFPTRPTTLRRSQANRDHRGTSTQLDKSHSLTISAQGRSHQERVVLWNHLIAGKGDSWQSLP